MLCGKEVCKLATLLELAADAPVFVFAMSARALRMADVSAVGAPLALPGAFAGCSGPAVKEMKSVGGLPGGVVEFTPTEKRKQIRSHTFGNALAVLLSPYYHGDSYRLLGRLASA